MTTVDFSKLKDLEDKKQMERLVNINENKKNDHTFLKKRRKKLARKSSTP